MVDPKWIPPKTNRAMTPPFRNLRSEAKIAAVRYMRATQQTMSCIKHAYSMDAIMDEMNTYDTRVKLRCCARYLTQ